MPLPLLTTIGTRAERKWLESTSRLSSTEAVQALARVNVTCVTPLGEEVASTL